MSIEKRVNSYQKEIDIEKIKQYLYNNRDSNDIITYCDGSAELSDKFIEKMIKAMED